MTIKIRTPEQLKIIRHSTTIWRNTIELLKKHIKEGISLKELDKIAEDEIRSKNAIPAFKGFHGFPATLCTMLNNEVVHGIPDDRKIKNGDLLTIDGGCVWKGWYSDAAFSVIVGGDDKNPKRAKFSQSVKRALEFGCEAASVGNQLGDIGYAIEKSIKKDGYAICEEYTGHGIGKEMHEAPHVYNYGIPGKGMKLKEGMTICIEPIVAAGNPKVKILSDGWTVVTVDGKDACQWEHQGVVTKNGLEIFV